MIRNIPRGISSKKWIIAIMLVAAMLAPTVMISGDAEAFSSDFSSSTGWTIIGTKIAIAGGVMTATAITRATDELAKHVLNGDTGISGEYNITFQLTPSGTQSEVSPYLRTGLHSNNLTTSTPAAQDAGYYNRVHWGFSGTLGKFIGAKTNEGGSDVWSNYYTYTDGSSITICLSRFNVGGQWKIIDRAWLTATGSYSTPVMSLSVNITTPHTMKVFAISGAYDNLGGQVISAAIDNYAEDTTGGSGSTYVVPTISTVPIVSAIVGEAYSYDVNSDNTSATYALAGCSWLSIDSASGLATGTPTASGQWNVTISSMSHNQTKTQIFWLRAFDGVNAGHGADFPLGSINGLYQSQRLGNFLYITFMDRGASQAYAAYITSYNYVTRVWANEVMIGDMTAQDGPTDTHGNPRMTIDNAGRIHVFYGNHQDPFLYKMSTNPLDITQWTDRTSLFPSVDATYAIPYYNDGVMYMMYRRTVSDNSQYTFEYRKSTDNGATWGNAYTVLNYAAGSLPYVSGVTPDPNDPNSMDLSWIEHIYAEGHRENVYYAKLNLLTNHLYTAAGADLGAAGVNAANDASCLAYNSVGIDVDVNSHLVRTTGEVIIAFAEGPYTTQKIATWNGSWSNLTLFTGGQYATYTSAIMENQNGIELYVCEGRNSGGDLYRYTRTNGVWGEAQIILPISYAENAAAYWAVPIPVHGSNDTILVSSIKGSDPAFSGQFAAYSYDHGFLGYEVPLYGGLNPPDITSIPVTTADEGVGYEYQPSATNNPTLWECSGLPSGATFSSSTGLLTWASPTVGDHAITLIASNADGGDYQSFIITVSPGADPDPDPVDGTDDSDDDADVTVLPKKTNWAGIGAILGLSLAAMIGLFLVTNRNSRKKK